MNTWLEITLFSTPNLHSDLFRQEADSFVDQMTVDDLVSLYFKIDNEIRRRTDIKISDNQNNVTWSLDNMMVLVDPSFTALYQRTGADYAVCDLDGRVSPGEMKATNLQNKKVTAKVGFSFHYRSVINKENGEENYLFNVHRNGKPIRVYDARSPQTVQAINTYVKSIGHHFLEQVECGKKNGDWDVVQIPEEILINAFAGGTIYEILEDGTIVSTERTSIFTDDESVSSMYSDYRDAVFI